MKENTKKANAPYDKQYRATTLKIGIAMLVFFGMINALTSVAVTVGMIWEITLGPSVTSYVVTEVLSMIAYIASFLVPAILLKCWLRKGVTEYQPVMTQWHVTKYAPLLIVAAIALNFAVAYMNNYLVTLLLPSQSMDMSMLMEATTEPYQVVLMLISIAVIPAIVEEILFRGVILTNLMPYGRGVAILGSAILFGLMHGNILQFLYTTLMGVTLGFIYVRTKSIWCGILIHFFNNATSVLQEALLSMENYDLAIRLISGIELAIMIAGAVSLVVLLIVHHKRRRPEEQGSFGVVFEPDLEYASRPIVKTQRLRPFFSPTVIVFLVLSCVSMLSTALMLLIMGAM